MSDDREKFMIGASFSMLGCSALESVAEVVGLELFIFLSEVELPV